MIPFRAESEGVLYTLSGDVVSISKDVTDELKLMAEKSHNLKIRICTHQSPQDSLHEMFIYHARDYKVRPHAHLKKEESISVLEGVADFVTFTTDGKILEVTRISNFKNNFGYPHYIRIRKSTIHTLIIRSEFLIFHEVTTGPFIRNDGYFPNWAPSFADNNFNSYFEGISKIADSFYK